MINWKKGARYYRSLHRSVTNAAVVIQRTLEKYVRQLSSEKEQEIKLLKDAVKHSGKFIRASDKEYVDPHNALARTYQARYLLAEFYWAQRQKRTKDQT